MMTLYRLSAAIWSEGRHETDQQEMSIYRVVHVMACCFISQENIEEYPDRKNAQNEASEKFLRRLLVFEIQTGTLSNFEGSGS